MKRAWAIGISALLCASLTLSGCAAPQNSDAFAETQSANALLSANHAGQSDGASVDGAGQSDGGASADNAGASNGAVKTDAAEPAPDAAETLEAFAFSNRDLSGEWDPSGAVRVSLDGASVSADSDAVSVSGAVATISAAGTYLLSGSLDDGSIIVDADKADKIQLVLDGVSIRSNDFAAIYVKQADKVFLTLADGSENVLSNGGTFTNIDDNDVDGVIFSKDDLTLNGSGQLTISASPKHGIVCKDDLAITGGTYEITADACGIAGKDSVGIAGGAFAIQAGKDGIRAKNGDDSAKGNLYLSGGTFAIKAADDGITATGVLQIDAGTLYIAASEGLEGNYIKINDGAIQIQVSDDGINATRKSGAHTPTIEINGGTISVAVGAGDTDGIDVNGPLIITGGAIDVTGNSAFDVDGSVTFTGGTVTINGQQVDSIPTQGFGGRGGIGGWGRNFGGQAPNGFQPPDANGQAPNNGGQVPNNDAPASNGAQVPNANGGAQVPNRKGAMRGKTRGGKNGIQSPDGAQDRAGKKSESSDATTSATAATRAVNRSGMI